MPAQVGPQGRGEGKPLEPVGPHREEPLQSDIDWSLSWKESAAEQPVGLQLLSEHTLSALCSHSG